LITVTFVCVTLLWPVTVYSEQNGILTDMLNHQSYLQMGNKSDTKSDSMGNMLG